MIKQHAAEVRRNFAEQVSHRLLADSPVTSAVVFENLSLRNMTRSAKGSLEAPGKNVAQKTGLNRELLARSLARIAERTAQKAVQRGRVCLRVPAAYSSQTCAVCGHVSAKNRPSQAEFHCRACGHQDHADANASEVIAQRGLAVLGLRPSGSAGRKTPVEGFYGAQAARRPPPSPRIGSGAASPRMSVPKRLHRLAVARRPRLARLPARTAAGASQDLSNLWVHGITQPATGRPSL